MSEQPAASGFRRGLIVGAILAIVLWRLGSEISDEIGGRTPAVEALDVIEQVYWRDVDRAKLSDASIDGVIRFLRKEFDDPFSHYFDPEEYDAFKSSTSGEFSGIGLTVSQVPKGLRVARVFENTPAKRVGIVAGEIITEVEGESIAGTSSDLATAEIKGPAGTEVTITVLDPDSGRERELTIERAKVRIPAVSGELLERRGVKLAYVRLATFSNGAHGELRNQIERLDRDGAEGLILDLRGNGGGLLDEGVLVASTFVEDGLIVSTEARGRDDETLEARGDALEPRPMVVLVDGDTASASEIVTAALADYDLATIVGTKTFGKGTVQQVIPLDEGGALDITIGEYFTSDGLSLAGEGIEPDVRAPDDTATRRDETLDRGVAILAREL